MTDVAWATNKGVRLLPANCGFGKQGFLMRSSLTVKLQEGDIWQQILIQCSTLHSIMRSLKIKGLELMQMLSGHLLFRGYADANSKLNP